MQRTKVFITLTAVAMVATILLYRTSGLVGMTSSRLPTVGRHTGQTEDEEQMTRMAAIHEERKDHVIRTCDANSDLYYGTKIKEDPGRLLHEEKHGLVYCYIPKNGCSFWKRVMSILGGARNGSAVFNLSSTAIHRQAGRAFDRLEGRTFLQKYHFLQSSNKFMFARDPYERLFSGYIDKIFSPCSMPGVENVIARVRHAELRQNGLQAPAMTQTKQSVDEETRSADGNGRAWHGNPRAAPSVDEETRPADGNGRAWHGNPRAAPSLDDDAPCDSMSSFSDFVEYVSNSQGVTVNDHFSPQHAKCFPCLLDYDYIGKMESFHDDANFILRSSGVDPALVFGPEDKFDENSDVNIIKDVAGRSFSRCRRSMSAYCMLRRLWATFQIRGFISINKEFPLSRGDAKLMTLEKFQNLAISAYRQSGDRSVVKRQRQQAFLEAYFTVPRTSLAKLERYVSEDCELFGYECSAESRFNISAKPKPAFHFERFWLQRER